MSTSLSATVDVHKANVNKLKDQYSGGVIFGGQRLVVHSGKSIEINGFMGSENVISLTSKDSIIHEAPACIAAPLVNMVAKNTISLGLAGQRDKPFPFRLYAPIDLSITSRHLFVGDLKILIPPQHGFLFCKKLTLSKTTEEDPESFEIIKSWAINDDMEIEVVSAASAGSSSGIQKDSSTSERKS